MKGTILVCLEHLVCDKFGAERWQQALKAAGINPAKMFMPFEDVDDAAVLKLVQAVCKTLDLTLEQAADAFGEYWVNTYSQDLYRQYYQRYATAREFLLALDSIHVFMTKTMPNARPPHFTYEWQDDRTLIMRYASRRHMLDFAVGLVKGIGKFYHEHLTVTKFGEDQIRVTFV